MSFLSSVAKLGLTPAAAIGKQILKVVKPSSTIAKQPISTTTSQLASTTFGKVLGAATTATAAALAVTSGVVGKVLPSTKAKVIAAVATPAAVSFIADKPESLVKVPQQTIGFSAAIGSLFADPSISGITKIVKEYPVASGITAAAGLITVGKGALPAVASFSQTRAIRENTKAIEGMGQIPETAQTLELPSSSGEGLIDQPMINDQKTPVTSPTQELTSTRKRRKTKKSEPIRVSQRVNVVVSQRNSQNKKYLNYVYAR